MAMRRQGRAALPILAGVFGSLGVIGLSIAAVLGGLRAQEIDGFRHAEGTVIAQALKGHGYSPLIEFSTPAGASVRFTPGFSTNPPLYDIGERLPVIYSPSNPSHALIDRFWPIWLGPMLAFLIGAPFAIAGSVCFVAGRRRKPDRAEVHGIGMDLAAAGPAGYVPGEYETGMPPLALGRRGPTRWMIGSTAVALVIVPAVLVFLLG